MSIWAIIIVVLAFGMMAWPLLLIKPSKQQQASSALRLALIEQGLKVHPQPPKIPEQIIRQYADLLSAIGFSKAIAQSQLKERYLAIRNPNNNEWFWPDNKRPPAFLLESLLHCYQALPAWCQAVEQGPVSSMIYAKESQVDKEALEPLLDQLNNCISSS